MENLIINPEKLKRLLSKKSYWGKGLVLSHWVQSTSLKKESIINVFVELNNEGFFINSYLIFDWNIPFVYDEEIFCFKENASCFFTFTDKNILIHFKDGLQAAIIVGHSNHLAAFGVAIHKKHLINRLSEELPYWEKEIECFVRNNDVKKSNTLLVNETGLYLNGIQKVAWKDYLLYELYPNVLQLMHDDTLLYWGSKETGFSPRKEHLVDFKDNVIICCGEYIYLEDLDKFAFESIKNALKRNLEEQEKANGNIIRTEISCNSFCGEIEIVNPISKTLAYIPDKRFSRCSMRVMPAYDRKSSNEKSLVLCVRFYEITDGIALLNDAFESKEYDNFNKNNKTAHWRFKSLNMFKQFSVQTDTLVLVNKLGYGTDSGKVYQYFLDFGQDVDNAATFMVQYLKDFCKVDFLENFKLDFMLKTTNITECKTVIAKAKNKSLNLKIVAVLFFCLTALLGLYFLFTGDDSVWLSVGGLLSSVFMLFYISKGGA